MKLPAKLVRNSFVIVTLAIALYAAAGLLIGWDDIQFQMAGFPPRFLFAMAGLSLVNYFIRFWRWEYFLRKADCTLSFRQSLGLYFTAYVMVLTPGKVGEVFKAAIMKEKYRVPLAKGLPVVLAERIYDVFAVILIAGLGLYFWPHSLGSLNNGIIAMVGLVFFMPLGMVALKNMAVRSLLLKNLGKAPLLRDNPLSLEDALESLSRLFDFKPFCLSTGLSTIAWLAECLGLWLACLGLGYSVPIPEASFTYAAGTLVGSLSFLPGGLGGTEATLVYLLQSLSLDTASAATVALLVRIFTLWLAVFLGLIFFLVFRREFFGKSSQA